MPLVSDPLEVEAIYAQARERSICLANFCTANPYTTEAILRSVWEIGQQYRIPDPPIIISATANYPIEPQLKSYTGVGDTRLGLRAFLAHVETLLSEDSPYARVRAMLHLDHGQPDADEELFPQVLGKFATIMYDCSALPAEENIARTRAFVERTRRLIRVEGAVTEIVQAEDVGERGALTAPEEAEHYFQETGVFLLVPNLGTEHRATRAVARYDSRRAREISQRVGKRLVLHGSSSLRDEDFRRLGEDGIVKVNIWTTFERVGAQAVARQVVHQLGNILPQEDLIALQEEGLLGERYFSPDYLADVCGGEPGPKLFALREAARRGVWMEAVVARMKFYLEALGYANWR